MTDLANRQCVPCKGGVPPLAPERQEALLAELEDGWELVEHHHLRRELRFGDFASALRYTNAIGQLAEEQGHHPDIHLSYGRVVLELWTHKIDGLTESDFVWAAKSDRLRRD